MQLASYLLAPYDNEPTRFCIIVSLEASINFRSGRLVCYPNDACPQVFPLETSARFMILFPRTGDTESQCYAIFHGKRHLLRAFLHGVPIHKHSCLISCLISLVLSSLARIFHAVKDTLCVSLYQQSWRSSELKSRSLLFVQSVPKFYVRINTREIK